MKRYTITILIILQLISVTDLKSQFNNNHWAFGDSVLISWGSSGSPTVNTSAHTFRNGSASISDSNGILLYTGYNYYLSPVRPSILNKFHIDISDSGRISGGLWYHSSMFIPHPGNDSIIYLFTIGVTSAERYGFYSTTINFKANNDSGVVLQKNLQWNNFAAFDGLMGVRHGNGRDWWVISQRWYPPSGQIGTNVFYIFKVTSQGISVPTIQSIGSTHSTNLGHLVFSNDGSKFVNVSIRGLIELYNFDRCTGTITSTIQIEQEPVVAPYPRNFVSCGFSKDGSKLFIIEVTQATSSYYLLQYNLLATNISTSKLVIDSFFAPTAPWQMKLAPDDKIYISAFDENYSWPYPDTSIAFTTINNNLSVINYPDSLGAACDFQPFSFNLGPGRSYYGLPNNPDYELGAWVGSPCDTLSVGVDDNVPEQEVFFQAWYNSEWNMIHVNASKLKGNKATLRLVDVEGRLVYEKETGVIAGGYVTSEINMQGIAKGMYIVNLLTEKEYLSGKVMK
ncbi:MAG: T9SS type A sorting domain-containing protein [Bacteroidetes bacterium]|nr:T9SS type A sorting domain-containing protein [Bacteroidota bacterium]